MSDILESIDAAREFATSCVQALREVCDPHTSPRLMMRGAQWLFASAGRDMEALLPLTGNLADPNGPVRVNGCSFSSAHEAAGLLACDACSCIEHALGDDAPEILHVRRGDVGADGGWIGEADTSGAHKRRMAMEFTPEQARAVAIAVCEQFEAGIDFEDLQARIECEAARAKSAAPAASPPAITSPPRKARKTVDQIRPLVRAELLQLGEHATAREVARRIECSWQTVKRTPEWQAFDQFRAKPRRQPRAAGSLRSRRGKWAPGPGELFAAIEDQARDDASDRIYPRV